MNKLITTLRMTLLWLAFAAASYFAVSYLIGMPDAIAPSAKDGAAPRRAAAQPGSVNVHDIDIELPDLDGKPWTLADWKDGPMLINFWGTWCPPCREEIPLLKELQDTHRDAGLTIVGIAIDDDLQQVRDYSDAMDINYPILMGDEQGLAISSALGASIMGLPISVFVDGNGRVTRMHVGEIHADDAALGLADILPP